MAIELMIARHIDDGLVQPLFLEPFETAATHTHVAGRAGTFHGAWLSTSSLARVFCGASQKPHCKYY